MLMMRAMIMLRMIVKPLDYSKIVWNYKNDKGQNYDAKKWVDRYFPLGLSILFTFIIFNLYFFFEYSIFFKSEAFYYITCFLQTLPGFYIAALAAIVSFKNDQLDEIDFDDCPVDAKGYNMTFRRFLSNTFAYLAWLSIFLIIYCISLRYIFEQKDMMISIGYFSIIYIFLLIPFGFFFSQLISITAMSLSYLGDRIHRP